MECKKGRLEIGEILERELTSDSLKKIFPNLKTETKTHIILSLLNNYRVKRDGMYLTVAGDLMDSVLQKRREYTDRRINDDISLWRIDPTDPTQIRSAFMGYALLKLYRYTRKEEYCRYMRGEFSFITSDHIKRGKDGHICTYKKGRCIVGIDTVFFLYPFRIGYAVLREDLLSVSRGIGELFALLHRMRDESSGFYRSVVREGIFGEKWNLPILSITNAYVLKALLAIYTEIDESIGMTAFRGEQEVIAGYTSDLLEKFVGVMDKKGYIPYIPVSAVPKEYTAETDSEDPYSTLLLASCIKTAAKYNLYTDGKKITERALYLTETSDIIGREDGSIKKDLIPSALKYIGYDGLDLYYLMLYIISEYLY